MDHVVPADEPRAVGKPVWMPIGRGPQQQRGRIHRAAGDDDEIGLDSHPFATSLDLDAGRSRSRRIGRDPGNERVSPDLDVG